MIVKIQQVRNLSDTISYLSQENKILDTSSHIIIAWQMMVVALRILLIYIIQKTGRDIDIKARMIIQSFSVDDNCNSWTSSWNC